jgi:hypothetical protein
MTVPVATSSAANKVVMPCQTPVVATHYRQRTQRLIHTRRPIRGPPAHAHPGMTPRANMIKKTRREPTSLMCEGRD